MCPSDNCWNQGVVLGDPVPPLSAEALGALQGRLEIGDRPALAGKADGPLGALAWVATLIAARGGGLRRGMIVMTGSMVPIRHPLAGDRVLVEVSGLGAAELVLT